MSRTRKAERRRGEIRWRAARRIFWKRTRAAFRAELCRILADLACGAIDREAGL